jgi:integral membrane protein
MTGSVDEAVAEPESLRALRVMAVLEGCSFVVLLVCSVLKRTAGPDLVPIAGTVHGSLYLVFVLLALENLRRLGWSHWFAAVMLTVGSPGAHFALRATRGEAGTGGS